MVKGLLVVATLGVLVGLVGCSYPTGAVIAPIMNTKSPVAVGDPLVKDAKTGSATVQGILFVGTGDGSIAAAMRNGGITRIKYVDSEEFNALGIYCTRTIIVHGE